MFSFLTRKAEIVSRDDALPGRPERGFAVPAQHEVLGTPLEAPVPVGHEEIVLAMGCFWGAERFFWQLPGVYVTAVGYAGGWTPNPTYEENCTGRSGQTESVRVVFDPALVSLETILKAFWENHDPTQVNGQGNDRGTQYRSAVFTTSPEQHDAVLASAQRYQGALTQAGYGEIATQIDPLADAGDGVFYYGEGYHQQYLHKNPRGYCNHGFCQVAYNADGSQQQPTRIELPQE